MEYKEWRIGFIVTWNGYLTRLLKDGALIATTSKARATMHQALADAKELADFLSEAQVHPEDAPAYQSSA
jgi:hypothetical protein